MTKLSSRLQSRVAKRRTSISLWEQERSGLKIGLQIIHKLKEAGMPGSLEAQLRGRSAMKNLKGNIKELVQDQQLDKQLLKFTYMHENRFISLENAEFNGDEIIVHDSFRV